ncbi:hypothetical protein [Stutzerimonas xanthomarina]|uniref:hypothetical protein n=1 Tax=Stutzerimonas xanthomarina TaxID=271420 RepID=UPI003AA7ABBC
MTAISCRPVQGRRRSLRLNVHARQPAIRSGAELAQIFATGIWHQSSPQGTQAGLLATRRKATRFYRRARPNPTASAAAYPALLEEGIAELPASSGAHRAVHAQRSAASEDFHGWRQPGTAGLIAGRLNRDSVVALLDAEFSDATA